MKPLYLDHWIPSLRGLIAGRAEPAVIKARLEFFRRGSFTSFITREGIPLMDPIEIVSWWEQVVEGYLFQGCPKRVRTILDVGANHGIYAIAARKRWPNVVIDGVEPMPAEASICIGRTIYRDVFRVALSDRTGSVNLYHATPGTYTMVPPELPTEPACNVPMQMADDLLCYRSYDIIKIDVDGGELEVVRGALKLIARAKLLIVECTAPDAVSLISQLTHRKPRRLGKIDWAFEREVCRGH